MKSYRERVLEHIRKEQKAYYEAEANRSALLWVGMMLLLILWAWAEIEHMEHKEQQRMEQQR